MTLTADSIPADQDALIQSLGFTTVGVGMDLWRCDRCRWVGHCVVRDGRPDHEGLEAFRDHADRTCPRRSTGLTPTRVSARSGRWPWLAF